VQKAIKHFVMVKELLDGNVYYVKNLLIDLEKIIP
jgi:hypothetical protein